MKKILLIGGTGAMGVYLIPELESRGFKVFITFRSSHKSSKNITYIKGNAQDKAFLSKILSDKYDAVVDFMVYATSDFKDRLSLLLNNTTQYIYLSSYRVFADSKTPIIESSPKLLDVSTDKKYLLTDEYALAKARQEEILRQSGKTNWTIVRPAITYSKNRFQLGVLEADTIMFRSVNNLPVAFPKEMLNKQATMTWAGDVANMIAGLILNKQAYGEDFNVTTSEHKTWQEICKVYQKTAGLKVRTISLQGFLKKIYPKGKYQVLYDRMFDRVLDNSKILSATGLSQKDLTKIDRGLKKEITDFLKSPNFKELNPELNARMDRITSSNSSHLFLQKRQKITYYLYHASPPFAEFISKIVKIVKKI